MLSCVLLGELLGVLGCLLSAGVSRKPDRVTESLSLTSASKEGKSTALLLWEREKEFSRAALVLRIYWRRCDVVREHCASSERNERVKEEDAFMGLMELSMTGLPTMREKGIRHGRPVMG